MGSQESQTTDFDENSFTQMDKKLILMHPAPHSNRCSLFSRARVLNNLSDQGPANKEKNRKKCVFLTHPTSGNTGKSDENPFVQSDNNGLGNKSERENLVDS